MRCDFSYKGDNIDETGIYMIWPEFEDPSGRPLPDSASVAEEGTATMWTLSDEFREDDHRHRINRGIRGSLVVGRQKIVEVTEVIGLADQCRLRAA